MIKAVNATTPLPTPAPAAAAPPAAPKGPQDSFAFSAIPDQHLDVAAVARDWKGDAAQTATVAQQLQAHLEAWPSLWATVAMAPTAGGDTHVMVATRDGAAAQSEPEGVYGIIARLSSSPAVKQAADAHPEPFEAPEAVAGQGGVMEFRVPGGEDPQAFAQALRQGAQPNRREMLQHLLATLPKGKRVALLLGGPSGAGKTTLINELKKMAGDRKITTLTGDMYFRDVDDPNYPLTNKGTLNWDNPDAMHMDEMAADIAKLVGKGEADVPIYDFTATRPGGWQRPVHDVTGIRLDRKEHVALGKDDILVIDSLHATNGRVVHELEQLGLPHASLYLDSPHAEDRLLRRIVRDYAQREGSADRTLQYWDLTTFPGEVNYIRPTLTNLDPAQDLYYPTQFNTDLGLSRAEIEHKVARLDAYGLAPTYPAFAAPDAQLPALARSEVKRLQGVLDSATATAAEKAAAGRALERLRQAPEHAI